MYVESVNVQISLREKDSDGLDKLNLEMTVFHRLRGKTKKITNDKETKKNTLEAWKSRPSVDFSLPNFTPSVIGATCRGEKSL